MADKFEITTITEGVVKEERLSPFEERLSPFGDETQGSHESVMFEVLKTEDMEDFYLLENELVS